MHHTKIKIVLYFIIAKQNIFDKSTIIGIGNHNREGVLCWAFQFGEISTLTETNMFCNHPFSNITKT